MHKLLRFAMPLAAAFLAALAAHFAIDVAGDYLLAHDTYDDAAHGSRRLASLALALSALVALFGLARALWSETRGSRGALGAALRAAVPDSPFVFCLTVATLALPLLLGMAWLDARCAGLDVDDVGDLLGGSIPLGGGILLTFALTVATATHGMVALLFRHRLSIVRAVTAFVRIPPSAACAPLRVAPPREDRARVPAALARCSGANRAPPSRTLRSLLV